MEENILVKFGSHIKDMRMKLGLSQAELAYRGNFNRNYIGMIERGERNPSLKTLERIAVAFAVDLSDLFKFK